MDTIKKELKRSDDQLKNHLAEIRKKRNEELDEKCSKYFDESFKTFAIEVNGIKENTYEEKINTFRNKLEGFTKGLSGHHNKTWRNLMESYSFEKQQAILKSCDLEVVKKSTHMFKP